MHERDDELDPCGKCGGRAEIMYDNVTYTQGIFGVECLNSGTEKCDNVLLIDTNTSEDVAIEYWNKEQAAKRKSTESAPEKE